MKLYKMIFILFCAAAVSHSQTKLTAALASENSFQVGESYPVDARSFIEKFDKANGIDKTTFTRMPSALKKTTAWNFKVGDTKIWKANDYTSSTFYDVPSTCRAVGVHCYVFVEDSTWTTRLTQTEVNAVVNAFDNSTPANLNKGIYQTDVETFGNPPDIDNDTRIIILILNIRDGWSGTGGYVAGYFHSINEQPTSVYANSNQAEIYYMDDYPTNLVTTRGLNTGLATCAHEFQHMIHWNYKQGMDQAFYDEGCSMVAEVINGYSVDDYLSLYSQNTNRWLEYWNKSDKTDVLKDYARATSFFLYLKEQFFDNNNTFFKKYVQSVQYGINAFDYDVLPAIGTSRRIADILVDWWVASYLNDRTIDPKWGFKYANYPKAVSQTIANPNVASTNSGVFKQAATYLSYTSGKNLSFNLNNQGKTGLQAKAVKIGTVSKQVVDVTANTNFNVADFGTTYNEVTFVVYHNDNNDFVIQNNPQKFPFTYSSTGTFVNKTVEIAYDTTPPVGVYVLSVGDTVSVRFDGMSGMRLDSIRVALRNTVQIEGGVWRAGSTTYLGQRLAGPFKVTGKTTPPSPYPEPWPNWVKVDLRSNNIDASTSFVVGFVIDGVYQNSSSPTNRVMHTTVPGAAAYHSFTYLHAPSSGSPGWYYLGDGTNISLYLIRAYVSNNATDVKQVVELTPTSYKLAQNYPNPFNPSTVINYQLPKGSFVTLKVYDMLGREVATLVDEYQNAGIHNSQFSIQNSQLSSGVYFYTIKADNYVATKKMILLK